MNYDPSEGVRSSLILPLLDLYFKFEYLQPLSGAIMQKLYNRLDHSKLNDESSSSKTIINLIFLIEEMMTQVGEIHATRYLGICRPKTELRPLRV